MKRVARPITAKYLQNAAAFYLERYPSTAEGLRRVLNRRVAKAKMLDAPIMDNVKQAIEIVVRSGLKHVGEKANHIIHWTFNGETGELVPNFTMITCNCDGHPLLGRLHKPDPKLPPDQQDKRAVTHIEPADWSTWLHGSAADARALVKPQATEVFDLDDARATDALMASKEVSMGAQGNLL